MDDARRPSRAPAVGALLIVAALAAVFLGALALWGAPPLPATARNAPPTGVEGRRAANPLAIADLGPGFERYSGVRSFAEVRAMRFLGSSEADAFDDGGAGAARMAVWPDRPEGRVIVVVARMADREAALGAADRLHDIQVKLGLDERVTEPSVVRLAETMPSSTNTEGKTVVRAHYVHGDLLVRVELAGREGEDAKRFDALLAAQLEVLPADG